MAETGETLEDFARRAEAVYSDPSHPAGLGGVRRLANALGDRDGSRTRRWLRGRESYTLHRQANGRFVRRPVLVAGPGVQLQADLMDVSSHAATNDGTRYLLTVVDAFSRRAWAIPMKNKSGESTRDALDEVVTGRGYRYLQTDKGKEFKNERVRLLLKREKMKWFSSENDNIKAQIVERFNRTLRKKIHVFLSDTRGTRFIHKLEDMVSAYNRSVHSSTGLRPIRVSSDNSERVFQRLFEPDKPLSKAKKQTLKPGHFVRIVKARRAFDRGFTPNWTREVFVVVNVLVDERPVVYTIKDLADEPVDGTFYERELQRVDKPEVFVVENVVRRRTRRGVRESLVKWSGYPDSFNSWVPDTDFV